MSEIMCWPVSKAERRYAGVTHIDVANLTKSHADGIREVFEGAGIELCGLGYYPNPVSGDRDEAQTCIKHLQKVIRAAPLLGCNRVNTFIGRDWTKSIDDNWPQFRKVWKPLLALAEQQDVCIGIENCPMLFTRDEWPGGKNLATSPTIWRRMFEEFPTKHFGLNFDPSHFVWQQMDYLKPLREFKDRLFHIHAKDVRIDPERYFDDAGITGTSGRLSRSENPRIGRGRLGPLLLGPGRRGLQGASLRRSRRPRVRRLTRIATDCPASKCNVPTKLRRRLVMCCAAEWMHVDANVCSCPLKWMLGMPRLHGRVEYFSLCSLCLCGSISFCKGKQDEPQRHREHRVTKT